jgi:hypothetical protein
LPETILYLELTAEPEAVLEAVRSLQERRASLERLEGFRGAQLLRSLDDPRVHLLEVGWAGPQPALGPPPGAPGRWRAWTFEVLE